MNRRGALFPPGGSGLPVAQPVGRAPALEEVRPPRGLPSGRADYSTTTEIADALLQKAEVPFRTGPHLDYGRGKGLKLQEIPFAEVQRIYVENANESLPLSESEYAAIISAEYMVFGRKGLGGPQVAEVKQTHKDRISKAEKALIWVTNLISKKTKSGGANEQMFKNLFA